ncbi:MAG TPA: NAD(P)-dependent alcohol dehydrogenase [Thermoanaerobaculia bacterium]|nr:NAD(P)-dependent alcohol dehydrogenase [Thermoanaerobaculia bacterium]
MKAMVIEGYGGAERLVRREVEAPRPGPGQVAIRVRATSVNPIDWKIRSGHMRLFKRARFPAILGFDAAGEVIEIGPEVSQFEPGEAVYGYLDNPLGGGYAEVAVARESSLAPLPPSLTFEEAAALPLAGLTALQALRDRGELAAGERLLVNGAAGGVGHLAVQIGAAIGARVTGVASRRNQELVLAMGAERAIDYEEVDFTGEEQVYDVVFDAAGNRTFEDCSSVLSPEGGIYVSTHGGPKLAIWALLSAASGLVGRHRRARLVLARPSGPDLAVLGRMVEAGKLRPAVGRVYTLEDLPRAHAASESGHARGKIVVRIE